MHYTISPSPPKAETTLCASCRKRWQARSLPLNRKTWLQRDSLTRIISCRALRIWHRNGWKPIISNDKKTCSKRKSPCLANAPGAALLSMRARLFWLGLRSYHVEEWPIFEERQTAFTLKIAAALLKSGKAKVKGLYSPKTGKAYDGTVLFSRYWQEIRQLPMGEFIFSSLKQLPIA